MNTFLISISSINLLAILYLFYKFINLSRSTNFSLEMLKERTDSHDDDINRLDINVSTFYDNLERHKLFVSSEFIKKTREEDNKINSAKNELSAYVDKKDSQNNESIGGVRRDFEDFKVSISEEGVVTRKEIHDKIQKNSDEINSVKKKLKI